MFHPSDEAYGLLGRVQSRIFFDTYLPGVTKKTRLGGHRCCECVFCLCDVFFEKLEAILSRELTYPLPITFE